MNSKNCESKSTGNITYNPSNQKFILSHSISTHQRNTFIGNKLHRSLVDISSDFKSCENSVCKDGNK